MSLPIGITNRAMVTTSPRVLGRVLRLTLLALFIVLPLLVYVGAQVPGIRVRYECSQIEDAIVAAKLERRTLTTERERLLAPDRLRGEAERLGLVPADLVERPGGPAKPRPRPLAAPHPGLADGSLSEPNESAPTEAAASEAAVVIEGDEAPAAVADSAPAPAPSRAPAPAPARPAKGARR